MIETQEINIDKFTFRVATDRYYTSQGIWLLVNDRTVRIGLSDFVQQRSGDVAFVDVKPVGTVLSFDDEVVAIETIKVTISFNSPISGKIVHINPAMTLTPELINQDPYGEGWMAEIEASDWQTDRTKLLDASAYFAQMKREAEEEVKRL